LLILASYHNSSTRAAVGGPADEERWDTYPPDSPARWRVIGRLLGTLQPGMTRRHVESIVGPGDAPDYITFDEQDRKTLSKTYYCHPPHLPPLPPDRAYRLIVVYDNTGSEPIFKGIWRETQNGFVQEFAPKEFAP
jgi:hypothetical protein